MIKTVLFDLGNVIFLFSHEKMCQQMGALFDQPGEAVRKYLFDEGHLKGFETGHLSERQLHQSMEKHFGRQVDFDALRLAASDIFELNHPIVPLIHHLHEQGFRLVLLSNTSISHMEFLLERYQILQKFDDFVLSYEVGSMKPQPEIYQVALSKIQCEPEACLYTDDLLPNIEGAIPFGFSTHLFTGVDHLHRALEKEGVWLPFANELPSR
jgi:HAD superfamily hydrolase (TIGR01509 family)